MALRNNLRAVRLARGETLTDVSAATGIDISQLSKVERCMQGFSDEAKLRLARHFGMSITELFFAPSLDTLSSDASESVPA